MNYNYRLLRAICKSNEVQNKNDTQFTIQKAKCTNSF